MKRVAIALIAFLGILATLPAFADGRIVTDSLESRILGAQVKFNVYLPDSYDESVHYPVIYLLHGLSDTYTAWAEKGNMKLVADELIRSGECLPVVIVMPNAGGRPTGEVQNGYFNMPGWNYEDFFFTELIPSVESEYHAGGSKGQRAVMGLSMGGGGCTVYCQRHPDKFSSCYAMSAWLDNKEETVSVKDRKDKLLIVCQSVCEHSAIDFIENADENTVEAMRTVKWFIDCGDDDFLLDLSVKLHQDYRARKIKSELRVRDGVHNWEYWHNALRTALPFASRNFKD